MKEIIQGAKCGNRESLNTIYEKYKNPIYYFCSKLIKDKTQAEGLSVETFSCAFEKLDTLENEEQFDIWIKNIAAIRCFNYIHKMKPMMFLQAVGSTTEPLFSESEIQSMPKGEMDKSDTIGIMDEMLNRLNDAQRMTLMLHYYNDLSLPQISKIMNCNEDIVKQRMNTAAEQMKNTVKTLHSNGIEITAVDFKTVLGLVTALVKVPETIGYRMGEVVDTYASDEYVPEVAPDTASEDYFLEQYNNSKIREFGALEEATLKYSDIKESEPTFFETTDEMRYSSENIEREGLFERFLPKEKVAVVTAVAKETIEDAAKKTKEGFLVRFKKLNMTQQSIAIVLVLAIVVGIIVVVASGNKNGQNPDLTSSASSIQSEVVSSSVPQKVEPVIKLEFETAEEVLKSSNGAELAKATYKYPKVTLSEKPEAAEKINKFFDNEKTEVLNTYKTNDKIAECEYMYSTQSYGKFKLNVNTVLMEGGLVNKEIVSFIKNHETYTYGNVYSDVEEEGFAFSAVTGERLQLSDVVSDMNGYLTAAKGHIVSEVQKNRTAGKYSLYEDYESKIAEILEKEGRWYLTNEGITVIFNPDEIVYITYGIQKVSVPYSVIGDYLKEEYKVAQ